MILNGKPVVVEYEPDTDLRDTEQVPAVARRGASRHSSRRRSCPTRRTPGTTPEAVRVGYEINFNRHFYKPQPMRSLEEIRADILALERETEGLLAGIMGTGTIQN